MRAAVVVPAAFAIARAVSPNPNVQLFAAFGSFALLLFVDFPGSPWTKLRSLGAACSRCGAVFIVVGTLCSTQPVAAVLTMAVVGFAVLFAGVLSPLVGAGTIAALLTFVLPIAVAAHPDEIPARLAGWLIAGVLAVPAILLVWPRPFHDDLRRRLASTARALATLVAAHADGRTSTRPRWPRSRPSSPSSGTSSSRRRTRRPAPGRARPPWPSWSAGWSGWRRTRSSATGR